MGAEEVLILMVMAAKKIGRAAAIKLIEEDKMGCGEHPACLYGVSDAKPIHFTIDHTDPMAKHPAPVKKTASEKGAKPPDTPDPTTLDVGDQPAPAAQLPADVESALANPYVKRFLAVGTQENYLRLPPGQPNRDDYIPVNYVRDAVLRLDEKALARSRIFAA
jgi:hypothetical protein